MYMRDAFKRQIPSLFFFYVIVLYTSKNVIVIFYKNFWSFN